MKQKKFKIVLIVIGVFLVFLLMWLGVKAMERNDYNTRMKGHYRYVQDFISSDESFSAQYGEVVSISAYREDYVTWVELYRTYVHCLVTTEDGTCYSVIVDYTYGSTPEDDVFQYIHVDSVKEPLV